jgi:hypothetical protein
MTDKYVICSRCFASSGNQKQRITKKRFSGKRNKPKKMLEESWWNRLWRRRQEELPTPDEAIAADEAGKPLGQVDRQQLLRSLVEGVV